MNDQSTPDEKPKRAVAKKVVAQKRQYFIPHTGQVVEAKDHKSAVELAKAEAKAQKDGDGK